MQKSSKTFKAFLILLFITIPAIIANYIGIFQGIGIIPPNTGAQGSGDGNLEKSCIEQVLNEDYNAARETVWKAAHAKPSEYAQAISSYYWRMKRFDKSNCPADFIVAYDHHLDAWRKMQRVAEEYPTSFWGKLFSNSAQLKEKKDNASDEISSTFYVVKQIAARRGLRIE